MKVIFCKGLPGSGKSTWSKEFVKRNPNFIRVNRDDIRAMINPDWHGSRERLVNDFEINNIINALDKGYSVVVDSTNLNPRHVSSIKRVINFWIDDVQMIEKDFTHVPLELCIERDSQRSTKDKTGREVIERMYHSYIKRK